jgi:hypothetical protein
MNPCYHWDVNIPVGRIQQCPDCMEYLVREQGTLIPVYRLIQELNDYNQQLKDYIQHLRSRLSASSPPGDGPT